MFIAAGPGALRSKLTVRREDPLGMEQINDLNGLRKLFIGHIPDPLRPIPSDYPERSSVESPALRFSFHPLGKL